VDCGTHYVDEEKNFAPIVPYWAFAERASDIEETCEIHREFRADSFELRT
jgi:hypothetical protein